MNQATSPMSFDENRLWLKFCSIQRHCDVVKTLFWVDLTVKVYLNAHVLPEKKTMFFVVFQAKKKGDMYLSIDFWFCLWLS